MVNIIRLHEIHIIDGFDMFLICWSLELLDRGSWSSALIRACSLDV